jgi:hypothetical protein
MKNKKFNPELLKEELKKFNLLSEYDFYQEKKELPEYKDLILGDIDEADDESVPDDLEPASDADSAADKVGDDLGVDAKGSDEEGETSGEIPDGPPEGEEPVDKSAPAVEPEPEPANDDVEVDVTSLVKGSEEAKHSADIASHNSEMLLQKLSALEARVANMDKVSAKIDGLEQEIIKRNPTPVEKLEMRSLSSYPYSQKLTDYWADKEGPYNVMNNGEEKKKEYVLTKDDVDGDYSDSNVKKSFAVKPEDMEDKKDYEEEDI